ncbi:unnamed protein product [Macrosiphum euphorbiae]|uniref:Uncharacterized protein n=1 Tax=Macrosiphum euphorbiae TaxID=13131 RepID=A0AAV0WDV5_9HEMI|nr:unnamed protein product [Macrosiphum euphorbiae]
MKVFLAAQVFSQSVAAGMETYLVSNKLESSSKATIDFIENMDKLFDIFNSSRRPTSKNFNRPFKQTKEQEDHFKYMHNFFTNLIIISKKEQTDVTNRMKFINGWLISITGLLLLWKDLKSTRPLNQQENYVLYTARLNQDTIENLFCTITQQNGNNTNPTPYQYLFAFKKFFFTSLFSTLGKSKLHK